MSPTIAKASSYAFSCDLDAAHVFACPHCQASSVGMNAPHLSNRQDGTTQVDIITIPLFCAACEAEWNVEFIASTQHHGLHPVDLVARVVKG